jgi:predicted esterase
LNKEHKELLEHTILLQKHFRYHLSEDFSSKRKLLIALHGYGQLAQYFARKFKQLPRDYALLVPEGMHRFYLEGTSGRVGASWMTKDDREFEIEDYCNYLQTVYEHYLSIVPDNCKIVLLGFSQGGATAMRWLVLNRPEKIYTLQLWGSDIPADLDYKSAQDYLSDKKIYWIYGLNDPYLNAERAEQLKKRFYQFELHPEIIQFEGAHEIDRKILGSLDLEIKS